jgi:hypothetical protein
VVYNIEVKSDTLLRFIGGKVGGDIRVYACSDHIYEEGELDLGRMKPTRVSSRWRCI